MNKKVKIALISILILGLGAFIFNRVKASQNNKVQYKTEVAEKGTLVVSLSASGQIATSNSRTVTTTASGVVKKVYVKGGDKVYTGTPILLIDLDLDGQQQLQQAYAQLQSAQNNLVAAQNKIYSLDASLTNTKNIFNNQWASLSPDDPGYIQAHDNMLNAQANYDALEATIAQAKTSLVSAQMAYRAAGATVYAPISGTVSAVSLAPGMILNPTSNSSNSSNVSNKIATVSTGAAPAITVNLTESDIPSVKVGDKVTARVDALGDKTYTGKVIAVDTTGVVSSGVTNYPAMILLDTVVPEMFANMSATVNIITDVKDNVLMVPTSAITSVSGVKNVRVMKNNVVTTVTVETGASNGTETEITSGLNEGDVVISSSTSSTTVKSASTVKSVFSGNGGGSGRVIGF